MNTAQPNILLIFADQHRYDAAQQIGQPFFIQWDLTEPHPPSQVPEPYFSVYPPETISPWPIRTSRVTG